MVEPTTLTVCITGAAGQIGYSFIPLVLTGQVFGTSTRINLRLLDIPQCEEVLKGLVLEIEDGAYPLLSSVQTGSDPKVLFKDIDVGVFIGGFPRKQGMERKELLTLNGNIFKAQGEALNAVAKPDCHVIVVANPANTNCLLLQSNCPKLPKENFTCLTRLDHNRALSQLALKANVHVTAVKNAIIWGNHSSTQYPDVNHATIQGKPVREVIKDDAYLNKDFIERVQKRGAEIIAAKKTSSVFSAANAVKDHLKDWFLGGPVGEWTSMGLISKGDYNVPKDICFSYPVVCKGHWAYEIVQGLKHDEFSLEKIKVTTQELEDEKKDAF